VKEPILLILRGYLLKQVVEEDRRLAEREPADRDSPGVSRV